MSVNKCIIVGHCTKDAETRYSVNGSAIANITVATNEKWKDSNGQQKEHSEFHRISFFGKLAEIAGQYLRKGSQVYIEGKLRTSEYTDKEGTKRFQTGIIADVMQMVGGAPKSIENAAKDAGKYNSRTAGMRDSDIDMPL